MTNYIHLQGAEDVRSAAHTMQTAASDMRSAANTIQQAVWDLRTLINDAEQQRAALFNDASRFVAEELEPMLKRLLP